MRNLRYRRAPASLQSLWGLRSGAHQAFLSGCQTRPKRPDRIDVMERIDSSGKTPISTTDAPQAIGPYSQAIVAGDLLFCSGQVGLDPSTGDLVDGGLKAQVERGLQNLSAVLEEAGASLDDVLKTTVFLVSMEDFPAMNEIYGRFFREAYPARSTVAVAALPKGAVFEIEAIVRLASQS